MRITAYRCWSVFSFPHSRPLPATTTPTRHVPSGLSYSSRRVSLPEAALRAHALPPSPGPMSDENKHNPSAELQFDTAEPVGGTGATATSLACTACSTEIRTSYYEVNGAVVCAPCRGKLQAQLNAGSRSGRFGKAVGFGLIAAAVGSALYYGVLALTGYEIGLVAIVVGFLVGRAVNLGSNGRGGRAYQLLAVGLTYFAIVTTYIPMIIKSAKEQATVEATADSTGQKRVADNAPVSPPSAPGASGTELQGTAATAATATEASSPKVQKLTVGTVVLGLAVLLAFAAAAPILAGMENIVGMVIIGIGMFEAWRQNQRVELTITGPYRVGAKRDGDGSIEGASA